MRSLNLDQLRALETVAELASFTGAARRLNLSQSAVSVQIRELEDRCGVRLIERLGKKAYATAAGREVIERARRISRETDAITASMRRFREGWIGRVHMGAALTALMYLLPPVLKKLRADHPGIDLFISNAPTTAMVDSVLQNEMDIGLVTLPVAESRLIVTPLHLELMVAILPASTPDIPEEVTPEYAAEQFLVLEFGAVSTLIKDWLSVRTLAPQSAMIVSAIEAVKVVVSAGIGMSVVPAMSVVQRSDDIVVRPLNPPLTRTLALIQHRNKPDDLALQIVRETLMELVNIPGIRQTKKSRRLEHFSDSQLASRSVPEKRAPGRRVVPASRGKSDRRYKSVGAGKAHHPAPLLDLVDDELAEIGGRARRAACRQAQQTARRSLGRRAQR